MKKLFPFVMILAIFLVPSLPHLGVLTLPSYPLADPFVISPSITTASAVVQTLGQLPLYFVENDGQLDSRVDFYIQGSDKTIYFSPDGVTFALTNVEPRQSDDKHLEYDSHTVTPDIQNPTPDLRSQRWAVKLDFVGANPNVRPIGQGQTEAIISYFRGSQDQWHSDLPTYSRIVYRGLWPGIDLAYYGSVNQLKYEFIIQPGVDPAQIRLAYRGADVSLNAEGQLLVTTPIDGFADDAPVAYQEIDGQRVQVAVAYDLYSGLSSARRGRMLAHPSLAGLEGREANGRGHEGNLYGFDIGSYDPTHPLVLDPTVLVYCGYIGGDRDDHGGAIAVDESGNAYITGKTDSTEASFPVAVGPDLTYNDLGGPFQSDAFVVKVNAAGTGLIYAGYIGGSGEDCGTDIALDGIGNAYVTGWTDSTEATFPVIGGPDLTYNDRDDAFVAKVNAAGTDLVYAGYIGGNDGDTSLGIAVDGAGNAYVTGRTYSTEATFPVAGGPDLTLDGRYDAFVAKVTATGSSLIYAGYIGGDGEDYSRGIAVDGAGNAYVTGWTDSTETTFPVTGGPDLSYNGGDMDAFVVKINATGSGFVYAGFLGGDGGDEGWSISVDDAGNAYVAGYTYSTEATFPVTGELDPTFNGRYDAFVAKVNVTGSGLVYAGYIGGDGDDFGWGGIAVDSAGNAYVGGRTSSTEASFPVIGGPDLTYNGGDKDGFVAKVNATGSGLVYAGYIGGDGDDHGYDIAVDSLGNAYVTGYTDSTEDSFPVAGGPDLTYNGGDYYSDAFVAKVATAYLISGQVADGGSDPISGVLVLADTSLHAITNAGGYYTLTTILTGTYTLTPTLSGYTFSPVTRTVSVPPDATGQDFTGTVVTWFIWLPLVHR